MPKRGGHWRLGYWPEQLHEGYSWDPDRETHALQVAVYNVSAVEVRQSFDGALEL